MVEQDAAAAQQDYADSGAVPYWYRTQEEIRSFFDRIEFADPGFVPSRTGDPTPPTTTP